MRKSIAWIVLGLAVAGIAAPAQALPVATSAVAHVGSNDVVEAGYFCGPGRHLGPYGHHCFPNGGPVVVAPVYVQPRYVAPVVAACPWGMHPGPYGHRCFRN